MAPGSVEAADLNRVAVLTRPGLANRNLSSRLAVAGWQVLEAPALHIAALPLSEDALVHPETVDIVVFVSGNAARIYLDRLMQSPHYRGWPMQVAGAAVGFATARALREHPAFGQSAPLHVPASDGVLQDSEGLFAALQAGSVLPKRVLIVRGEAGREWLADQFRLAGASVEALAVYRRTPAPLSDDVIATLQRWQAASVRPMWLYTSAASLHAIASQIECAGLDEWWASCPAVVTHPRIADALHQLINQRAAGTLGAHHPPVVKISTPDDQTLFDAFVAL